MYPKLSKRKTADGKPIYTYVCKMKERSQRSVCNNKNANGNTLDMAIIEQMKTLQDDHSSFIDQLEASRKFYTGNRADYEERLSAMQKEKAGIEKKINTLVDSLAEVGEGAAKAHVARRIEQLNQEYEALGQRIQELEGLTSEHALSDIEFDVLRQLLQVFREDIDHMSIQQKRAAIRTVIRKVVWDGVNAHVVLFGVQDDEIAYPEIVAAGAAPCDDGEETEELVPFWDVAYEQSQEEGDSPEKPAFGGMAKTPWGTDSE